MRFHIRGHELESTLVELKVPDDSRKVHLFVDGIDVGFFDDYDDTLSINTQALSRVGLSIHKY